MVLDSKMNETCESEFIDKSTSVFHASVLLLIIYEFHHNIVKVAVDP